MYFFFSLLSKKKKLKFNFFKSIILIFILFYIFFNSVDNVDSPMYHLQILKWKLENKVVFGLSNLEIRFGANSLWHSLVSILDLEIETMKPKYYLSVVIISIFLCEIFLNKKYSLSSLFLNFSFLYLFFFSLIHPYNNGIILNHLGNPELDIVPMTMFLTSIYILSMIKTVNKENFYLYCFSSFFCITSRFVYLPLIIPIFIFLYKSRKLIDLRFYFLFFGSLIWLLNSFINSGCLIFPYTLTCFEVNWSPGIENIDYHLKEVLSYSRDGPFRINYKNFDYTLNSYQWLIPWILNYFFETSFLIIFSSVIIISLCILIFFKFRAKYQIIHKQKNNKLIFFIIILTFIIWFQAPEVRLGLGVLLALPSMLFAYALNLNLITKKYFNIVIILNLVVLSLFFLKNFFKYYFKEFFEIPNRTHDFSQISKLGSFDNYEIYISNAWRCADFDKICVNKPRENYTLSENYGYLVINAK